MIHGIFAPAFGPVAEALSAQLDRLQPAHAGGVIDGRRFLARETVATATEVQSRRRDAILGWPMRWRLGFHGVGTLRGMLPQAFGHFGYGGSGAWADPGRNLALAMTVNRVAGTPIADGRILRLGALAIQCADRA